MPRIKLEGVSKSFGKITALEQVNFEMQDGEYITILGPSGCGKTTMIKIVAGIWTPTEGRVLVDNKDITNTPMEERDLGYVFQNIILFPHMNVKDNAGYSPRVKGDRKSTRLNSSHDQISYAVFCLKKKKHIVCIISSHSFS